MHDVLPFLFGSRLWRARVYDVLVRCVRRAVPSRRHRLRRNTEFTISEKTPVGFVSLSGRVLASRF